MILKFDENVKKRILLYAFLIIALTVENSLVRLSVFGIEASFVLPVILLICFNTEVKEATVAALLSGILLDFEIPYFGVNAIYFSLLVYFISFGIAAFFNKSFLTFIVIVAASSFLYYLIELLLFCRETNVFMAVLTAVLPKTVLMVAAALIIYFAYGKLLDLLTSVKRRKNK